MNREKTFSIRHVLACVFVVILTFGWAGAQTNSIDLTCRQALDTITQHQHDTTFVILDVRTKAEFDEGHLRDALNVDFQSSEFEREISKLNRVKTYLVYCKGGVRSAKAITVMKKYGFKHFYHLFEGMMEWERGGFAIVK